MGNPLVSKVELANTLRQLRTEAGRTLEESALVLEVSAATMSRIETGARIPRARDVRELCRFYGVADEEQVEELAGLVAGARATAWWEEYSVVNRDYGKFIGYEEAATRVDQFENANIPALLQIKAYGEWYFRTAYRLNAESTLTAGQIEERLKVRALRCRNLANRSKSLICRIVMDEVVLLRTAGEAGIMKEQIRHLVEVSAEPWVEIRILPVALGMIAGPVAPFTALTLPQSQVTDVVYMDTLNGQEFQYDKPKVEQHKRVLADLRSHALSTSDSLEMLVNLSKGV